MHGHGGRVIVRGDPEVGYDTLKNGLLVSYELSLRPLSLNMLVAIQTIKSAQEQASYAPDPEMVCTLTARPFTIPASSEIIHE